MENDKQIEIDVAEWLIDNSSNIQEFLRSTYDKISTEILKNHTDMINYYYKYAALTIIKEKASKDLTINPEQLSAYINEDILNKIDSKLLLPPQ